MSKLIVQAIINKVKEVNKSVLLGISEGSADTPAKQLKLEAAIKQYHKENGGNTVWANALHKVLCSVLDVQYRDVATNNGNQYPAQWALLKSKHGFKKSHGTPFEDGTVLLVCNVAGYVYHLDNTPSAWVVSNKQVEKPTKEEALEFIDRLEKMDPSSFFAWFNTNIGVGALNTL